VDIHPRREGILDREHRPRALHDRTAPRAVGQLWIGGASSRNGLVGVVDLAHQSKRLVMSRRTCHAVLARMSLWVGDTTPLQVEGRANSMRRMIPRATVEPHGAPVEHPGDL